MNSVILRDINENYILYEDGTLYSNLSNKKLKPRKHNHGYLRYQLVDSFGKRKDYYIHRLVLKYFKYDSNLECNHIDGNKENNHIINLEYVTSKKNKKHGWDMGLYNHKGENHYLCTLKTSDVLEIRNCKNKSNSELAFKFKVTPKTIRNIKSRYTWKHV